MQQRERSLDMFRGLTLAAMIMVNTPGTWAHIYAPLRHASWHGITPTDLIFPFFVFIVGAAMFHSMGKLVGQAIPWKRIGKRAGLLFLIGLGLNAFPFTEPFDSLRYMGVLQRIAIAYFIGAVLIVSLPRNGLWIACGGILLGYRGLLNTVPEPYTLEGNIVRQWDLALIGANHLYQGFGVAFDPEGLLSTLPAVVTLLMGYQTSAMLSNTSGAQNKCKKLLALAVIALTAGYVWNTVLPINKALWTSSYVLVTTAWAWIILAAIIFVVDIVKQDKGFKWMEIYGTNPLFIYVLAWIYASVLLLIPIGDTSAYGAIYQALTIPLSEKAASLAFALIAVSIFYALSHWLYKKRIFIKL